MSRKTHKKHKGKGKGKGRKPNLPATTMLAPRLSQVLNNAAAEEYDAETLERQITPVLQGVSDELLLTTLLRMGCSATLANREHLEKILPVWLDRRQLSQPLLEFAQSGRLSMDQQRLAVDWLQATSADSTAAAAQLAAMEKEAKNPRFLHAMIMENEFQGNLMVFFCTDSSREKSRAMGFLLDFNPPWNGAVKDVLVTKTYPAETAVEDFLSSSTADMPFEPVDDIDAKWRILDALSANRRQKIRLPRDLISVRGLFQQHILNLPDTPDTTPFTMDDFDELSRLETSAEEVRVKERVYGFQTKMPDGETVVIRRISEEDLEEMEMLPHDEDEEYDEDWDQEDDGDDEDDENEDDEDWESKHWHDK